MSHFTFDFAISFAGEDRPIAEQIADKLTEGGAKVFYDYYYKSELLGKKLGRVFPTVYGPSTRFFVPIISKHYIQKDYTNYEWRIAKEEERKRKGEFILPLRLDDSKLIGLHTDVVFVDLRTTSSESAIQILLRKSVPSPATENTVWVATVGLVVGEVTENWEIPRGVPRSYPDLCDWLERDLRRRLTESGLKGWEILEDSRSGETLSVRFKFCWSPTDHPLDFGLLDWWEVLEVVPLADIYPDG